MWPFHKYNGTAFPYSFFILNWSTSSPVQSHMRLETLSQKGSMGEGGRREGREGESHTILLQSATLHVIMFPAESFCACMEGAVPDSQSASHVAVFHLPAVFFPRSVLSLCSLLESPADRFSLVCSSSSVLKLSSSLTYPILSILLELILVLMCLFMMGEASCLGFVQFLSCFLRGLFIFETWS